MNKDKDKNCIDFKSNSFEINGFTRMKYDNCAYKKNISENIGPGEYALSNFHSCECGAPDIRNVSLSQPTILFKDGKGWVGMNGCEVDKDSQMRISEGNQITHWKCKKQLYTRPYLTVPYMGKGVGNPCVESMLKPGE